jgi:hypothetical protein
VVADGGTLMFDERPSVLAATLMVGVDGDVDVDDDDEEDETEEVVDEADVERLLGN